VTAVGMFVLGTAVYVPFTPAPITRIRALSLAMMHFLGAVEEKPSGSSLLDDMAVAFAGTGSPCERARMEFVIRNSLWDAK
jgi:hypothetical protein